VNFREFHPSYNEMIRIISGSISSKIVMQIIPPTH